MSANFRSLTLANGLRVSLCSAPRLKRCAAALRVLAGSHDVPQQWPGLAHFIEHLLFLGTERFPADEKLMTFVQRHGGQVNASTRERTTEFFFELPPSVFAQGLERLCDMLIHPRMALDDQLREREVLHAEFIAWSQDDASRDQRRLLTAVSMQHPLRWFHAGNRFSLPVPRKAFQQALQGFYQRFYHAAQMTLSIAGPQSLDELATLATKLGGAFVRGDKVEQADAPRLLNPPTEETNAHDAQRLHLTFACEELPDGNELAAEFFCAWVNNAQAGGLIAELRDRGLASSLKAEVLYQFGGQAVLDIDIGLNTDGATEKQLITGLFFDWLSFFKSHYPALLNEYALLQQRRLVVSSALVLARHYSQAQANTELSAPTLNALLHQLKPNALLHAQQPSPVDNIAWRLPEPNPFLRPAVQSTITAAPLPALTVDNALPANDEGAVYLRWTLQSPQPRLHKMLSDSLGTLTADAQQAGVTLAFSAYGNHWQLRLAGLSEPIPAIAAQALRRLSQPDSQTLARYRQASDEAALIPIRQLLKTLPDHFLNSPTTAENPNLATVWAAAKWLGFASGLNESSQQALISALHQSPGKMLENVPSELTLTAGRRWQTETSDSSEVAVLLFCPTPSLSIEDEAIWRLLAHVIQAPFYQRLRVELQLGYAVFSGLRQICGQTGLLFGVQSPTATAEQLVMHIESVIKTLPTLIAQTDLPNTLRALSAQLDPQTMDTQQATEMLWQAHLAGHGPDYQTRLQHSLATFDRDTLLDAAGHLLQSAAARLYVANRCNPGIS
jgi:coenzyme PQQ biosynthesis probable peptidase PqqF